MQNVLRVAVTELGVIVALVGGHAGCAPHKDAEDLSATLSAQLAYSVVRDGAAVCDAAITWSGSGEAERCPDCDFVFEVDSVTTTPPDDPDCLGDGAVTLHLDPSEFYYAEEDGGLVGFWQAYSPYSDLSFDRNLYLPDPATDFFVTGSLGYRWGYAVAIDWTECDGCGGEPPGAFERDGDALAWTWSSTSAYSVALPPRASECPAAGSLGSGSFAKVPTFTAQGVLADGTADTWRVLSTSSGTVTVQVTSSGGGVWLDILDAEGCLVTPVKDVYEYGYLGYPEVSVGYVPVSSGWFVVVTAAGTSPSGALDYELGLADDDGVPAAELAYAGVISQHVRSFVACCVVEEVST